MSVSAATHRVDTPADNSPSATRKGERSERPVGVEYGPTKEGPHGGPGGATLGTSRSMQPSPAEPGQIEASQAWRRTRYERRQQSSEWLIRGAREAVGLPPVADVTAESEDWVRPPRPARCRWRCAADVTVHGGGDQGAHFSGTERCGSIWACPVCAAVIRAQRAEDIQRTVEAWQEDGGSVVFVTLTMRHTKSDPLAVTLNAAAEGFRRLLSSASYRRDFAPTMGIEGYVRSVEVTLGSNGWHPHVHALFFVRDPLSKAQVNQWTSEMFSRWAEVVTRLGAKMPSKERGVDVRVADTHGKVIAEYLSKLQEAKIGSEVARFDFKTGKGGNLMPFELLDPSTREDDWDDHAAQQLWWEWYTATKGRRAITFSRSMLAWLKAKDAELAEDIEMSDDQIIEDAEQATPVFKVDGKDWDRHKNSPARLTGALDAVEAGDLGEAMDLLNGYVPAPVIDFETGEITPWHGGAWTDFDLGRAGPEPDARAVEKSVGGGA